MSATVTERDGGIAPGPHGPGMVPSQIAHVGEAAVAGSSEGVSLEANDRSEHFIDVHRPGEDVHGR